MTSAPIVYCMDTSVFIDAFTRHLQPIVFKSFWRKIDELIGQNRMVAPRQVLEELERVHDDVFAWAKERQQMFLALDVYAAVEARNVAIAFPKLATRGPHKNYADPFVVALAKSRGLVVVTQEKGGSTNDPKIPFICQHFKIPCFTLFDMMISEQWEF